MPLSSMTGFGQAELLTPSGDYHIEIRGVNGRYLDIQTRMPRSFLNLEAKIKNVVSSQIARGSVTVNISWNYAESDGKLVWDKDTVDNYMTIFKDIRKHYKLKNEVSLANLLSFSDFIKKETVEYTDITIWRHLKPVLEQALQDFSTSRKKEAAYIVSDLKKVVKLLIKAVNSIEQRAPVRLKKYTVELKKRVEQLADKAMDPSRLAIEVAVLADKLDIAEECTRLRAHIESVQANLESGDPVGKRIGFILQEMNREANTIASKANDTKISHWAVVLKENVEKIREQMLNIE